jgi:catechol 2,3-dioxygenase-like lactoylglutathione lyase family enzyme
VTGTRAASTRHPGQELPGAPGWEMMRMQKVVPTFRITDYARSKAFYLDGLGFKVEWEHRFEPQFPVFACIQRDGMELFLTEHTGDCPAGGLVHLYVADVDAWYAECQRNGVPVQEPPNQSLQGLRDMTVVDPDGNKLRICTRLPGWSRA